MQGVRGSGKTGVWGFIVKRSVLLRRSRTREQSKERPEERMKTGRETGERHSFGSCLAMKNFFAQKLLSLILFAYFLLLLQHTPSPKQVIIV